MRVRSSLKLVFAFAVLAYASSPAGAQTAQPTQPAAGAPAAGADQSGTVGFQRKTSLTPAEQLTESSKHLARMEQSAGGVRKMLEEARKQRDVVKTLCLNDKLSQIDVAIRSGRDRRAQLQAAANRNDAELSGHEFTILTVLRQRSEQLVAEANQCIGEEAAFVGDTRTNVTIDPSIAPDETPYPSTDPSLVIAPPPCASCTL
jgi:flagellar motor protein MotB